MIRTDPRVAVSRFLTFATIFLVIAALHLAKEVLVPIALAMLLSFLLAPLVSRLERLRLGRIPSVVIVVALSFTLIGLVGWIMAGQVVDLAERLPNYIVLEIISNNFMEPWLYGSSAGVSTVAILVAAVWWTWIWGPVGLMLATPLTVCLVVIGRHVPHLKFLDVLFGDEPVLEPHVRFYQRLLAADQDEARKLAEEYLEKKSVEDLFDRVFIPALRLEEEERHRGGLEPMQEEFVRQSIRDLAEEMGNRGKPPPSRGAKRGPCVLCLPARDEADEIAGLLLAQILERRGFCALTLSPDTPVAEVLARVEAEKAEIVCISAVPPFAVLHARNLAQRLRSHFPEVKLLVGLWTEQREKLHGRLAANGNDAVATTCSQAMEAVERWRARQRAAFQLEPARRKQDGS